jgi:methylase of polypeptide subunit release factors
MTKKSFNKRQFGDFQTPDNLAQEVVNILKINHQIVPQLIIEPSCGTGSFIRASLKKFESSKILGFDINERYVQQTRLSIANFPNCDNATIQQADFFNTDWNALVSQAVEHLLIIGNPPWVTSSELSLINSQNLPIKSNFQKRKGIEAITGLSHFDISEWMLLTYIGWLSNKKGTIAILCKYNR